MVKPLSIESVVACGVEPSTANTIMPQINHWLTSLPAEECWQHLTQSLLTPDHPFALHKLLYETTFADWDEGLPAPAWFPSEEPAQATNLAALMRELQIDSYPELHTWSVQNRSAFWEKIIQQLGIRFHKPYLEVLDLTDGIESPRWLIDAQLNIVESCFQAPREAPAIVFQPEGGKPSEVTYGELDALINRVANGLVAAGFHPGDRIVIVMPMTVESVAIYLGIIKAGCVVVSIADSFSAPEISMRLRLSQAKAVFTQNSTFRSGKHLPLYQKIVDANAPKIIVLALSSVKLRAGDSPWETFLSSNECFDAVPTHPDAYTNILFSSGTTGEPKAIPWTQTTPIKCASDGHFHHDIHPADVVAWSTSLGWMMGPWLIYASFINQATIALYGGAPTGREFGQFVQDVRVTMLGVVPSLVSAWKASACMQGLDWRAIKNFSSTGECSNPQDMLYLMSIAGYKPVIEYCGGTEIGGGYVTGTMMQPAIPATFTTPALGLDFVILDSEKQPANKGEVFLIPPSIGLSTELLNRDHHQVYFAGSPVPGLRRHGDQMERLPNGYYRAQGRVDDTMNLGGIKVSAIEIEQALNTVPEVCETAAIAVSPAEGGPSQLVIYAIVAPDSNVTKASLFNHLQAALKQHLNPLFKIHDLVIVDSFPRTASNKLMRRQLRDELRDEHCEDEYCKTET